MVGGDRSLSGTDSANLSWWHSLDMTTLSPRSPSSSLQNPSCTRLINKSMRYTSRTLCACVIDKWTEAEKPISVTVLPWRNEDTACWRVCLLSTMSQRLSLVAGEWRGVVPGCLRCYTALYSPCTRTHHRRQPATQHRRPQTRSLDAVTPAAGARRMASAESCCSSTSWRHQLLALTLSRGSPGDCTASAAVVVGADQWRLDTASLHCSETSMSSLRVETTLSHAEMQQFAHSLNNSSNLRRSDNTKVAIPSSTFNYSIAPLTLHCCNWEFLV